MDQRTCSAVHCKLLEPLRNRPINTRDKFTSKRTDELTAPPGTGPADSAAALVVVWVGTKLKVLELTVELEELVVCGGEVVVVGEGCQVDVVGNGSQVVMGIATLVVDGGGGGGGEGDGDGDGEEPPESKFHEPYTTPAEISEKYSKRLCERSRPSAGQLGHCCDGI